MKNRIRKSIAAICVCVWTIVAVPVFAANSSPWAADLRSAVRIVSARSINKSGTIILRAGVEIKLDPGWHTYGREPAESGVPPTFDFKSSENVKSITVLWPKPERLYEGNGYVLGYKNGVMFPLRIVPKDRTKPVTLRLELDYAICEKLCIPSKAKVELAFSQREDTAFDAAVSAAEARVPKLRR